MASGVDDDGTLRANREGYKHVQLRPRRLRDATKVDMRVELFGTTYNSPIFLCPTAGTKRSAPTANWPSRAQPKRAALCSSCPRQPPPASKTSTRRSAARSGISSTRRAPGKPAKKSCERVEAAGCPVIALTVDNTTGRNSETYLRTRPKDLSPMRRLPRRRAFHRHSRAPHVRRHRHDRRIAR